MKLTKIQLKQIIKEELENYISEELSPKDTSKLLNVNLKNIKEIEDLISSGDIHKIGQAKASLESLVLRSKYIRGHSQAVADVIDRKSKRMAASIQQAIENWEHQQGWRKVNSSEKKEITQ